MTLKTLRPSRTPQYNNDKTIIIKSPTNKEQNFTLCNTSTLRELSLFKIHPYPLLMKKLPSSTLNMVIYKNFTHIATKIQDK